MSLYAILIAILVTIGLAVVLGRRAVRRRQLGLNPEWQVEHQRRVAQFPPDVQEAHKHSSNHRAEVLASTICGCFYCGQTFAPAEIEDWIDETDDQPEGTTALCPKCGIDSVIGDRSGFPLTPAFLQQLNRYWF